MRIILFVMIFTLLCLLLISFERNKHSVSLEENTYSDSISLSYNGKKLISSNQQIDELSDSIFLNGVKEYKLFLNDDFKKFDDTSKYGYINFFPIYYNLNIVEEDLFATIDIAYDKTSKKIVYIQAFWGYVINDNDEEGYQCRLLELVSEEVFPFLTGKTKCEDWWSYTIEKEGYIERFVLEPPEDENHELSIYNFCYYVEFR